MSKSRKEKREEWKALVSQWQQSGLSARKWSQSQGICYKKFLYWKERYQYSSFLELKDHKSSRIEIECRGLRVYLDQDFEELTLKRCLQVLRGLEC